MLTVDELETRLDELRRIRAEGRLEVRSAKGRVVVYQTDAALAAAIADLERNIASMTTTPVTTILVAGSKGLDTA
jgi:hypothetical protein